MGGTGKRILTHSAPKDKKTRRRRRLTWKERLIVLLPATAALIALAVIYIAGRDLASVTLTGSPVQYYGGAVYRIPDGASLRRTTDEKTLLGISGNERALDSLPIYYENSDTVLLPENMVYYAPRSGKYGRIAYFSEISIDSYGKAVVRLEGSERKLEPGFLYDGKNLYLFLEPVQISFNGYCISLPALSYVEAVYSGDVMVFDFGVKQFFMEAPDGMATADVVSGDYSVSLLGDYVTLHDGKRTLLFTRPEQLDLAD